VSDAFVPLATILRPPRAPVEQPAVAPVTVFADEDALEKMASEVRSFRARLAEAFDATLRAMLRDMACNVLARELACSPANLAALAAEVLAVARDEMPVCVRASGDDCEQLESLDLPVIADPALRSGDLIVELRDGELDLRLGVRLDALLREHAR
jgi:flagellar biosynthesis/type III secretory pathway protein FliH